MKILTNELKKMIKIPLFGHEFFNYLALNLKPQASNLKHNHGAVAQLGERQNRTLEVGGSTPLCSTKN